MNLANNIYLNTEQYGKFSPLITDYLLQKDNVKKLYSAFPSDDSFVNHTKEKLNQYKHRELVHKALSEQMSRLNLSEKQIQNLEKFKLSNTVTVTTGHQLNLLTGPLYFFYKILQVIRCCEEMNIKHPEFNYIPVFWMATEDHDFAEINHFYHKNQTVHWEKEASGAVGRLNLDGINEVFNVFSNQLPNISNAHSLKELIQNSYLNSKTLSEATQKLVQSLFNEFGLMMIDGDDKELKKLMIPSFQDELINNTAFKKVSESNQILIENNYSIQVNPREINLFYLGNGNIRERIVFENEHFYVLDSEFKFTQDEIISELNSNPQKFSPNALLRPFYQETVLPNIAYIGGSGEIAYWLQLKSYFDVQNVLFPLLIVRNSVLILNQKQQSKLERLDLDYQDLFSPLFELVSGNVMQHTDTKIDFAYYKSQIQHIFNELSEKSAQTDITFANMVNAQRVKQLKGMTKMEQRLVKAEKKKNSERVERIENIYSELFPKGNLQERVMNFSDFWIVYGNEFVKEIYDEIHPYEFRFIIKTLP